jgi:hypothetical protein
MTGPSFVLHHLREPTSSNEKRVPVIVGGPLFVSFDPSTVTGQRQMVLFLSRAPGGRYAPYPDQKLAGAFSVYPVDAPSEGLTGPVACKLNPIRLASARLLSGPGHNP